MTILIPLLYCFLKLPLKLHTSDINGACDYDYYFVRENQAQTKLFIFTFELQYNPANSNSPLTRTKSNFPWITPNFFSHLLSANSNSPLTRTNFTFPWLKFTLITRTLNKNVGR